MPTLKERVTQALGEDILKEAAESKMPEALAASIEKRRRGKKAPAVPVKPAETTNKPVAPAPAVKAAAVEGNQFSALKAKLTKKGEAIDTLATRKQEFINGVVAFAKQAGASDEMMPDFVEAAIAAHMAKEGAGGIFSDMNPSTAYGLGGAALGGLAGAGVGALVGGPKKRGMGALMGGLAGAGLGGLGGYGYGRLGEQSELLGQAGDELSAGQGREEALGKQLAEEQGAFDKARAGHLAAKARGMEYKGKAEGLQKAVTETSEAADVEAADMDKRINALQTNVVNLTRLGQEGTAQAEALKAQLAEAVAARDAATANLGELPQQVKSLRGGLEQAGPGKLWRDPAQQAKYEALEAQRAPVRQQLDAAMTALAKDPMNNQLQEAARKLKWKLDVELKPTSMQVKGYGPGAGALGTPGTLKEWLKAQ